MSHDHKVITFEGVPPDGTNAAEIIDLCQEYDIEARLVVTPDDSVYIQIEQPMVPMGQLEIGDELHLVPASAHIVTPEPSAIDLLIQLREALDQNYADPRSPEEMWDVSLNQVRELVEFHREHSSRQQICMDINCFDVSEHEAHPPRRRG